MDNFVKFYGGENGKIATDEDNYRFLIHELNGPEPLTGRKTPMPTDDPVAAAIWFRKVWERAGVPADSKRTDPAMAVFNRIKGTTREQARAAVIAAGGGFPDVGANLGTGDGNLRFGRTGSLLGVAEGYAHSHFENLKGGMTSQPPTEANISKLIRDTTPAIKMMADRGLKPELSSGKQIEPRKDSAYYASLIREGVNRHTHSGPKTAVDVNMPGFPKVPFSLKNIRNEPNSGQGINALLGNSNSTAVFHLSYKTNGRAFHGRFIPKSGIIFAHEGEYVIDKDSVNMVGRDFFEVFNDVENSSQMKQKANFLISRLSQYVTTYRGQGRKQTFVPVPVPTPVPSPESQGGVVVSPSGSSSGGGYSDLYRGG